jgi:hypothetical protein
MMEEAFKAIEEVARQAVSSAEKAFLKPTEGIEGGKSVESKFLEADSGESMIQRESTLLPRNGGEWGGEPGDSTWHPDAEKIPQNLNPEQQSWGEIQENHELNGIPFKDGYPEFSKTAESIVKIDDFSLDRDINFAQADRAGADQWSKAEKGGRADWKPSEVNAYRKGNNLTWHECEDMKTMELVPSEVHGNVPHQGGIAEFKKQNAINGDV